MHEGVNKMDKLMELLEEGRAWSVKDLADSLQKP